MSSIEHRDESYYIWNHARRMWWKPREFGYTNSLNNAGVYRESDAKQILNVANSFGTIEESMIPLSSIDSLRDYFTHTL